jgi:hypothetical protein
MEGHTCPLPEVCRQAYGFITVRWLVGWLDGCLADTRPAGRLADCIEQLVDLLRRRAAMQLHPSKTSSELMPGYTFYTAGCRLQLELEEVGDEKLQAWQLLLELSATGSAASSIQDPSSVLMDLAQVLDPMAATKVQLVGACFLLGSQSRMVQLNRA